MSCITEPKQAFVFTREQYIKFLNIHEENNPLILRYKLEFALSLYGCLRIGELLEINWNDIKDTGNKIVITICRQKNGIFILILKNN